MGIVISAVVGGIGALASAVWGGVSYAIALGILGLASIVIRTDPGVSMPTIDPSFHDAHVMMRYTYGHDGSMGVEHIRGRNFTLGAFDAETGQGSLYGSGVEGEEVPRVNVTGVFFQGDHRPNGTMVMTMPGGVLHHVSQASRWRTCVMTDEITGQLDGLEEGREVPQACRDWASRHARHQ